MKPTPSYNDVTYIHLSLYRLIGFLPRLEKRFTWRSGLIGIFHFAMVFYEAMHLGYEIRMVLGKSMNLECIFEGVLVHGLSMRYLILQIQREDLLELEGLCGELWQRLVDHESKIMKKFERKVSWLRYFFFWNTFAAIVFYIITALFTRLPPETPGGKERRFLAFKHFMEVHEGPLYLISFFMQDIVCVTICVVITGIETVGPFLIMMACGYMKVIQHRLLMMARITNDNGVLYDNVNVRFGKSGIYELADVRDCVKFHQKIIVFCQKIEEFTRGIFMIQVLSTGYNTALIGITVIKNDPDVWKYIPVLMLNVLQFFTCQWIPQHLIVESEEITNAAYAATLLHSEYEHKANRMLLFMILRAERPVQLTAGGYINLSLETFQQMFVNAISFFAVLRKFKN